MPKSDFLTISDFFDDPLTSSFKNYPYLIFAFTLYNAETIKRRHVLTRKRKRALVAAWANLAMIAATSVRREVRMHQWTQDWSDRVVGTWGKELWVSNFCMRQETFEMLCVQLSPILSHEDTSFRQAISVQRAGYRTHAKQMCQSAASVCLIVREFCHAVRHEMMREYIKLPEGEELQTVLLGFKNRWVIAPLENHADYFNCQGWHSVILQAVDIQGTQVPIMLLGDPAYPLRSWLMKGYPETGNLTENQRHFNKRLSGARMMVECAFGRLKGRWRCLSKRLDVDISLVATVTSACCTLHNICEKIEAYCEDPSATGPPDVPPGDVDPLGIADIQPARIREALTQYFGGNSERDQQKQSW
uniref:DDE Tnp4 domain-containing protein n=1 Tax=Oryzias latipes TaxID=8090 RepID=A0A3P9L387_ORYLA